MLYIQGVERQSLTIAPEGITSEEDQMNNRELGRNPSCLTVHRGTLILTGSK